MPDTSKIEILDMSDWKPIETAPQGTSILLWWRPVNGNIYAETAVLGQIGYGDHKGEWWNCRGEYQDVWHLTHWMPLPDPPIDSKQSAIHPEWKGPIMVRETHNET